MSVSNFDEVVKSKNSLKSVIPAQQTVSQFAKDVIPDSRA
jgi:hypothetical protein